MRKLLALVPFVLFNLTALQVQGDGQQPSQKELYQQTGLEGVITGTISLRGEAPVPRKIDMGADPRCRDVNTSPTLDDLIVNDGAIANVFVYIESGGAVKRYRFEAPSAEAVLYHRACQYAPRVVGIQTGQKLVVLNSDLTIHNTHPVPNVNPEWNMSQEPGGRPIERTFNRPELFIPFKCNQHPWQRAYVSVLQHPFFSVSGDDGYYRIEGVPPGNYRLEVWHEKLKPQTLEIFLGPNEVKKVDFILGPEAQ